MKKIYVHVKNKKYPILIGFNIFKNKKIFSFFNKKKKILLITNNVIKDLWLKHILNFFYSFDLKINIFVLKDGEKNKIIETSNDIITYLLKKKYGRDSLLVAFGGGVIGDIVGFTASIYQRGIPFIQIPTTLLAQVDASVGGKTGVNHILGKNMIGTFWQPECVLININFLSTLSRREYLSGMSEVIKYAIAFNKPFFFYILKNIKKIIQLNSKVILKCILKSCNIKSKIVAHDERELGNRALLNLGHTYGHAIESYTKYKKFLHGESVSIGIIMAARTAISLKKLNLNDFNLIIKIFKKIGLPVKFYHNINVDKFIKYMYRDKKNILGNIRLVLPIAIGKSILIDKISTKIIKNSIKLTCK
ncbi:3-dehydroquinate synthase [Buchnera aphidicola]|uniref:3-dehydroquinate synthase n=1 Tax=Buchnera aphidicola TaxID=9 RepID=UPI0030EDF3FC